MRIKSELEQLIVNLKQQRDEVKVQMHLASMEAKEELENAEEKFSELNEKLVDIADEAKETGEDFIIGAKAVAEELNEAYERIKYRLKE